MSNACAYCRKPGVLTREHIYPKFLYRGIDGQRAGFNEAADKVTHGERVIKDVCAVCNNESLGALDEYGQKYYTLNNLDHAFTDEKITEITYDYNLLLRWVLKISYNSFRTIEFSHNPFASLIPFILTGENKPKPKFIKLLIEVIKSHNLNDGRGLPIPEAFQKTGYIPCHILNSGRIVNFNPEIQCHCRHFQLNAHRFTLFLFSYQTRPSEANQAVDLFRKQFPFAMLLDPNSDRVTLPVSQRDIVDIQTGPHVHPQERFRERQHYLERVSK